MNRTISAAARPAAAPRGRRDAAVTALALLAVLAWDASGLDLWLSGLYGQAAGFPLRGAWATQTLLHDGGRSAAWVMLALLAWDAWRPRPCGPSRRGPSRRERTAWLGVVVASLLLVPLLKRFSATSCPWDLALFGGAWPYVPHGWLGRLDGGPGHCFPSGHAVAAFAFFGLYFLWRDHRPRAARRLLAAVLAAGVLFGWAQLARGAHFASHTLWSAWLCWALAALAAPFVAPASARAGAAQSPPGPTRGRPSSATTPEPSRAAP